MIDVRFCTAKRGDPLEKLRWNLTATNVVDARISVSEEDAKTFATFNTQQVRAGSLSARSLCTIRHTLGSRYGLPR